MPSPWVVRANERSLPACDRTGTVVRPSEACLHCGEFVGLYGHGDPGKREHGVCIVEHERLHETGEVACLLVAHV